MTNLAATQSARGRTTPASVVVASHETSAAGPRSNALAGIRRALYRMVLVTGIVIVATAVAFATSPAPADAMDASLVRLMRGMAMIKAGIIAVAAAVLWWRFARPIATPFAVGYLLGSWFMVAATVLIWQLSSIGAAAIAFHTGEVSLLLLAWRDTRSRANA